MRITTLIAMIEAIVFTLGVGVGIVLLRNFHADPSDWLGFAGALIGAGVTVLGALLVVEIQTNSAERSKRRLLTDQIDDILRWTEKVRHPQSAGATDLAVLRTANSEHLKDAIARLKETKQWVVPADAEMVQALAVITKMPDGVQVWWGLESNPTYIDFETVDENLRSLEASARWAKKLLG
jgi:hypothetical protein